MIYSARATGRSIPAPGNIVKKKTRNSKYFSQRIFITSAHFSVEVHAMNFIISTGLWGVWRSYGSVNYLWRMWLGLKMRISCNSYWNQCILSSFGSPNYYRKYTNYHFPVNQNLYLNWNYQNEYIIYLKFDFSFL